MAIDVPLLFGRIKYDYLGVIEEEEYSIFIRIPIEPKPIL